MSEESLSKLESLCSNNQLYLIKVGFFSLLSSWNLIHLGKNSLIVIHINIISIKTVCVYIVGISVCNLMSTWDLYYCITLYLHFLVVNKFDNFHLPFDQMLKRCKNVTFCLNSRTRFSCF